VDCGLCLQRRWRTVDPDVLEETAAELWRDERLRSMGPTEAASDWLKPLAAAPTDPRARR